MLRQARVEAEAIIGSSRADAERLRAELRDKARSEAEGIIKNAERQIQLETARALEQINNQIQSLQNEAAMLRNMAKNLSKVDFAELEDLRVAYLQGDEAVAAELTQGPYALMLSRAIGGNELRS